MAKKSLFGKIMGLLAMGIGGVVLVVLLIGILLAINFVVMYILALATFYAMAQLNWYHSANIWIDSIWLGVIFFVLSSILGGARTVVSSKK